MYHSKRFIMQSAMASELAVLAHALNDISESHRASRDFTLNGLRKALTRRPVADDAAEKAADEIEAELRSQGTTEVDSSRVGALAMAKLREIDQIAYIRFASVYQSFEGIEDLKREVDTLWEQKGSKRPSR